MNKNLRILKWIYTEGLKENPMPYKELLSIVEYVLPQLLLWFVSLRHLEF